MHKTAHPIDKLELMAYLDGELPREHAAAAAAHLENCIECKTIADNLKVVSQELTAWQIPPSDFPITPDMLVALDQHLRKQESAPKRYRWSWLGKLGRRRVLGWSFVGAAALLLMMAMSLPNLLRSKQAANAVREEQDKSSGLYDSLSTVSNEEIVGKRRSRESVIPTGPMVIRTAELTLIAADFDQARGRLEETLKRHGGYLGQLTVSGSADAARTLTATLRLPAAKLDGALAELKKLGRVESESQKGDEISQQYVDLQARLTNARNTEQRLTEILRQRTGKLADVLAVEREIASVREGIERMEAEKKNLETQVAFSTVNLKLTEDYKQQVHMVPDSTSRRIRNAAVNGYETLVAGLINVLLFFVSWGPSLLVWGAILFFPVRMLWKRWRKRELI